MLKKLKVLPVVAVALTTALGSYTPAQALWSYDDCRYAERQCGDLAEQFKDDPHSPIPCFPFSGKDEIFGILNKYANPVFSGAHHKDTGFAACNYSRLHGKNACQKGKAKCDERATPRHAK